jgi:hypothetical protein
VSCEAFEVALNAGDDACVPGNLGVPAAFGGVVAERRDVGELGLEGGDELGGGDVVVALLADVGVGTCFGCELPGAVPVSQGLGKVADQVVRNSSGRRLSAA